VFCFQLFAYLSSLFSEELKVYEEFAPSSEVDGGNKQSL
jgi:hypothetical protein